MIRFNETIVVFRCLSLSIIMPSFYLSYNSRGIWGLPCDAVLVTVSKTCSGKQLYKKEAVGLALTSLSLKMLFENALLIFNIF